MKVLEPVKKVPLRSIMQFLPLWSMDDKAEAEPKTAVAEHYHC